MQEGELSTFGWLAEQTIASYTEPQARETDRTCVIAQILVRFARALPRLGGDHDFNPAISGAPAGSRVACDRVALSVAVCKEIGVHVARCTRQRLCAASAESSQDSRLESS